jgi:hypothetical protein
VKPSRRSVVAALAIVVGGCGAAAKKSTEIQLADPGAAPVADVGALPPFAVPGERMVYRLSVLNVEVGMFGIAVGEPADLEGRRVVAVEAGVQSTGIGAVFKKIRTDFASWIDVGTGRPVLSRVTETAGASDPSIEVSEVRYLQAKSGSVPIAMTAPDGTETVEDQVIEGTELWDVPSVLMYLRGWDAADGAEVSAQVVRSRYIWRGQFRVVGRESRTTELGRVPTVKIEGVARRVTRDGNWEPKGDVRTFSVWISDDADRVPVLVVGHTDFGDVKMELLEYAAGEAANLRKGS